MRIVFMGTADFGIPTLRVFHENHDVSAVVTVSDTFRGRGRKPEPTPVKVTAHDMNIPVIEAVNLSDPEFTGCLNAMGAELFFVVAFRILPEEVFSIPPLGTVNLHASLLPDYRGAAPINHAVINGDDVTGLTTFYIDRNIDTGDIILKKETPIGPEETAGELTGRMKIIGADLSLETVNMIEKGTAQGIKQPMTGGRPAPKIFKKDGLINWKRDAQSIHNHVRGMNPFPGAFTEWKKGPLKIHRTKIVDTGTSGTPGLVTESDAHDGFIVSCGSGALRILEVQPPGKKVMDGASFVRGYRIEKNYQF